MTVYRVPYWDIKHKYGNYFHVIAHGFANALGEAANYLNEELGEGNWEILEIEMKPNIRIVNSWLEKDDDIDEDEHPLFEGDCSCPYCVALETDPKFIMKFKCDKCGFEIAVADNHWTALYCKQCENRMERKDLKFVDGSWLVKK
jgi:hypothetical protein